MNDVHFSYDDYVCYLAYEVTTGVQVFWYEFIAEPLSKEEREGAFQRILRAKGLGSQNILSVLDTWWSSTTQRLYVITEGIQSPSMKDYLRTIDTPPSQKTCAKWFRAMVAATYSIHQSCLSLRHGDISLENMYIKPTTGVLKLKLPLASLVTPRKPYTFKLDQYTAPETLNGVYSNENDIWSLGICLLNLLTNKIPYSEYKTPIELAAALAKNELPQCINDVTWANAKDLITQCLQPIAFRITIEKILVHPMFSDAQQLASTPASQLNQESSAVKILYHSPPAESDGLLMEPTIHPKQEKITSNQDIKRMLMNEDIK